MEQYNRIKSKYPDALLLFRVGDFYETFGQDAIVASGVLGIVLTKRNNGAAMYQELAGFPYHALDNYLPKLVKAGYRVAVCDQLEDPKMSKTVVKRGVTEIITPGVTLNNSILHYKQNNYVCAIALGDTKNIGIAFLDISTGEFQVAEGNMDYIDKLIQGLQPAEILINKKFINEWKEKSNSKILLTTLDEWVFQKEYAQEKLLQHFQTVGLKGYGIDTMPQAIIAAGAILYYLNTTEHPQLQHITTINRLQANDYCWLDKFSIRNLEILNSNYEGGKSLIDILDHSLSPMGARLMRKWVLFPLKTESSILYRQAIVTALLSNAELTETIRLHIKNIADLERILSKVPLMKISPREVIQLKNSLVLASQIKAACMSSEINCLHELAAQLVDCEKLINKINDEISEEAPIWSNKGNIFKKGIYAELDELRHIALHGKEVLAEIQVREQARTGIPSLKIGFNNVFGYYLEVTDTHKNKVPSNWMRKQTLANAERFITSEIKEFEEKILGAEENSIAFESKYFIEFIAYIQQYIIPIQQTAQAIAMIDCLQSFAFSAAKYNYCAPSFNDNNIIDITQGRHAVIEQQLSIGEEYIPNDLLLNKENQQMIIITGPNMSGKSAILRQTALIVLMAQIGSYVPAQKAHLCIIDRLFTRVGASDNISSGESTFMVEMNETASILNNITDRSLILLDEIGRGTSTYDGISIAWSIGEYLHQSSHAPLTLFATHYHELNELENKLIRIKNYHVATAQSKNKVIFLRKLVAGGSTHSFGIHVARMAGMPHTLIERANVVMHTLEQKGMQDDIKNQLDKLKPQNFQLSIFDQEHPKIKELLNILHTLDINIITPVDAILVLSKLKKLIEANEKY